MNPRQNARPPQTSPDTPMQEAIPVGAVFTIDDLVVYLKLPKSTAYKLAQEGKIPGQKVGRHWRFHKDAVDRWLCNQFADTGSSP